MILSRDGLAVAASQNLSREDAEHLSALAAGVQSLARGAGEHFGVGEVRQTIIELEQAFLFVTAAGHGSCLAVLCSSSADAGLMAYEMAMLVKRAGPHLAAHPRFPAVQSPGGVTTHARRRQVGRPERRPGRPPVRADRRPDRPASGMLLDLITVIVASSLGQGPDDSLGLSPEHRRILGLCRRTGDRGRRGVHHRAAGRGGPCAASPISSSRAGSPCSPSGPCGEEPSTALLKEVLHGLRAL